MNHGSDGSERINTDRGPVEEEEEGSNADEADQRGWLRIRRNVGQGVGWDKLA